MTERAARKVKTLTTGKPPMQQVTNELLPCPTLDDMRSYAEAALKAGWHTAVRAAVVGKIDCAWERGWFEKNPPESAVPEEHWTRTPDQRVIEALREEVINTPETADFMAGVPIEAAHQRARWGSEHDAGKSPFDWFWLVGYLAQKAASAAVAGDTEKAKHHTISTAAALANWHLQLSGQGSDMRPGIGPLNGGDKPGSAFDLASKLETNGASHDR